VNSDVLLGAPTVVPSGATLSCYQARQPCVSRCRRTRLDRFNPSNQEHERVSNGSRACAWIDYNPLFQAARSKA
jgi:hypothetical protein